MFSNFKHRNAIKNVKINNKEFTNLKSVIDIFACSSHFSELAAIRDFASKRGYLTPQQIGILHGYGIPSGIYYKEAYIYTE